MDVISTCESDSALTGRSGPRRQEIPEQSDRHRRGTLDEVAGAGVPLRLQAAYSRLSSMWRPIESMYNAALNKGARVLHAIGSQTYQEPWRPFCRHGNTLGCNFN